MITLIQRVLSHEWGKKFCYTISSIGEGMTFAFITGKTLEAIRGEAIHVVSGFILTFGCVIITFFTNRWLSHRYPKKNKGANGD